MRLDINQCGPVAFLLVVIGVTGFVASLFAILMAILGSDVSGSGMRARIGIYLGPGTALLGLLGIVLGIGATTRGRHMVDEIVASDAVAPADVERLRAQGYAEVGTCTGMGIQSGGMPLAAGLVATALTLSRRRAKQARPTRPA